MARPKKVKPVALASVDECTAKMAELLTATADEEAAVARRDLGVARLTARYEPRINDARKRKADCTAALEDYYYAHLVEIEAAGVKHLQLPNGRIGRREHPAKLAPLNRSWNWKRIGELVQAVYGRSKYFLEKDPTLDKDKLKAELAIAELKQLGLTIETGESFYADPARLPGGADRVAV